MLDLKKLKEHVFEVYKNNISIAAKQMNMPKTTLFVLLRGKRNAGLKTMSHLKNYCQSIKLPKDYFFIQD